MQTQLQEALQALRQPDRQVLSQARAFLLEFQRSEEAWQVSDGLLHDGNSNLETLILCAVTLKTKVRRDFKELPREAFFSLRDSLKNLLKKYSKGPSEVRMQICMAMSALAVHVSVQDWGCGGILNWLRVELGSNPDYLTSCLELLRVLPQTVQGASSYIIAARPERHGQFEEELISSAEVSFGFLASCLSFKELHEQVFNAFASWLRLSLVIPSATLASHSLVLAAISALNLHKLFDAALNAICELIHYTVCVSPGGLEGQMPLVQVLVSQVMELRSRFSASLKVALMTKEGNQGGESGIDQAYMEDDKIVKGMARLFVKMGVYYVEWIASGSAESMMIVDALVDVTSHPEYDISKMTFKFWHRLQTILTEREYYYYFGNEAAIDSEMERRLTIFRPRFESLVSLVSFRVICPQNHEDSSKKDKFKRIRCATSDILKYAASVLGVGTTLKSLSNRFFQEASTAGNGESWDWQSEEAVQYILYAISRAVPMSEGTEMSQYGVAMRLWMRIMEEVTRNREMERRQKQRLDEMRENQKKDEETMHLKDQLRGQVRADLEQVASQCKDMASLLRHLGIPVEGGAFPLSHEVNAAYRKALLRFHPDHAWKRGLGEQVEAEETFKLILSKKTSC